MNGILKNFYQQNRVASIENDNLAKQYLGIKKLHPNKKCNALFVNNTLRLWNN